MGFLVFWSVAFNIIVVAAIVGWIMHSPTKALAAVKAFFSAEEAAP
jgi:hypothetical protein